MQDALGWVVHPLAALALSFLASVIFTGRRFQWPPVLVAALLLAALSFTDAHWVVHPAAALCIAVLAANIFHAWRREWPTILCALTGLALFVALGAFWAVFPLVGLGFAWLATVVFSGDLFRPADQARPSRAVPGGQAAQALPAQGSGQLFDWGERRREVETRVEAKFERQQLKHARKLARKAARWGVSIQVPTEQAPAPVTPPPSPTPAPESAADLLTLMRDERLPAEARARLGALHLRATEAARYLEGRGLDGAEPGYLLRQIVDDYAPEAVRAYLRLPPSLAGVTKLDGQKTGRDLLGDQLDMLLQAVQNVMEDATTANGQAMLAHGRFLADKFGKKGTDFEV